MIEGEHNGIKFNIHNEDKIEENNDLESEDNDQPLIRAIYRVNNINYEITYNINNYSNNNRNTNNSFTSLLNMNMEAENADNLLETIYNSILNSVLNESFNESCELEKKNINIIVNEIDYGKIENSNLFDSCVICQEKFEFNNLVANIECKHIFYTECLKEWGKYKPECPVCKLEIKHHKVYAAI